MTQYADNGIGVWATAVYQTTPQIPTGNWKLPDGHFIPTRVDMRIAAPRPDEERTENSRYSWAYPGLEYTVPIAVIGGSYPFYYQIIARSGPASIQNATIGETRTYNVGTEWYDTQNFRDYGVIRWIPAIEDEGEAFSFTVQVTGQDYKLATIEFSGTVQADKFTFIQDGAAPGGDGTLNSPYEDLTDLWVDRDDDRWQGQMIVLRAGTYSNSNDVWWTEAIP